MRDLLARETTDVRAAEAVALFCYQAKKWMRHSRCLAARNIGLLRASRKLPATAPHLRGLASSASTSEPRTAECSIDSPTPAGRVAG